MTTVTYTHQAFPASTLVEGIYYDKNTRELTVDLNDEIYRYSDVPESVFNDFVVGRGYGSVGKFYTPEIKRAYGPGEYLGEFDDVYLEKVNEAVPAADMGPVSSGVGTPKNLVYAEGARVYGPNTTGNSSGHHINLVVNASQDRPSQSTARYEVKFLVDGKEKVHTLDAASVVAAAQGVEEIADMLDLTFDVVEVRRV